MTINERKLREIIRSVLQEGTIFHNPMDLEEDLYILIDDFEEEFPIKKLKLLHYTNATLAILCRNSRYKFTGIEQFVSDLRSGNEDLRHCLESAIQDESRMDDFYKYYKAARKFL